MTLSNLKSSSLLLLIGLVSGFCMSLLINGCNSQPAISQSNISAPKVLKREAESIATDLQQNVAALQAANRQLKEQLQDVQSQLVHAKKKTAAKETSIKQLIEPHGLLASTLLLPQARSSFADTALSSYDSLSHAITEYMQDNNLKDSLYECHIATQDSIITVKDSTITLQTSSNQQLRGLLDQSLAAQQLLTKENKHFTRKAHARKFIDKVALIATALVAGFTANALTHR